MPRYVEINPFLSAKSTNSALFLILRDLMISYLWNMTVFSLTLRMPAISFIGRPSASNCRTSRWRSVNSF